MQYFVEKIAGIKTVLAPIDNSNSVTVQIFANAWSIYENQKINGISHFLEHMFFKWWKKYTTPKQVAEFVDSFGGEFNAFTSDEMASYYVKCAPEFKYKALDVLSDMMVHAQFPKEEMEREKWVVIQEIMMKEDSPSRLVYDMWKKFYYGDNRFGRSTLWTKENVMSFGQEDLHKHKNNFYTKDNIVIVVTGNINDIDWFKDEIAIKFANLPEKSIREKIKFDRVFPKIQSDHYKKGTEQNHLILACEWFDGFDDDRYAAGLLSTILWWNMSSRLFQNVREKEGLCYYIAGAHYSSPQNWFFLIRSWLEKWRFEFGKEKIIQEIQDIASGNINENEYQKALGYRKWQIQMWIESSDELAGFLGEQMLLYNRILTLEQILEKYESVSLNQLKSVAKKLEEKNLYSFWIE